VLCRVHLSTTFVHAVTVSTKEIFAGFVNSIGFSRNLSQRASLKDLYTLVQALFLFYGTVEVRFNPTYSVPRFHGTTR
jgi:hypothetical protein